MKKLSIAAILLCITFTLQAQQTNSKGFIGLTFSGLGSNDAFHWEKLAGAGGYEGKGFNSLGVTYIRPINSRFDLEAGVEYSRFKYRFTNASLGPDAPEPYIVNTSIVGIPVTARLNFLRYFFINAGLLLDVDVSADKSNTMDSQSGIGVVIGVGAKYDFRNAPVGIFVNPYYKHHTILPFSMGKYHLRTDEAGFRLGVVYRI